jgi:nitrogen fixation protein FixH
MSLLTADPKRFNIVPWLFVAGFAIVIAVNATMMWLAIGSFSGLYSNHARHRGVHYNDVMAEQRSREALGWTVEASWQADRNLLGVIVNDGNGQAILDARVAVDLVRPAEKRAPIRIELKDLVDGRFTGAVALPARGNWDADIVVEADGHRFARTLRLFLR